MDGGNIKNDFSLNLYSPQTIISLFCIYSPVILLVIIFSLSFINQTLKGFILVGFLFAFTLARGFFYSFSGKNSIVITDEKTGPNSRICNLAIYTHYGNSTVSSFIFAFVIIYLSFPMFKNKTINYWLLIGLIAFAALDIFYKTSKNCYGGGGVKIELVLNIFIGILSAFFIVLLMDNNNAGKYLFFNEIVSNNTLCYKPKNTKFKCSVYKNGTEIIPLL